MNPNIHQIINQHIETAKQNLINSTLPPSLKTFVNIKIDYEINSRLRVVAGKAIITFDRTQPFNKYKIIINENLFNTISQNDQKEIILHEYAHLIDAYHRNTSNHDETWKTIYKAIGGNGKTYHNYQVKKNRIKRFSIEDVSTGKIYNNVTTRMINKYSNLFPNRFKIINCTVKNS